MTDNPLKFTMNLEMSTEYSTRSYALTLLQENVNVILLGKDRVRDDIVASQSSRKIIYREMNPGSSSLHSVHVSKHAINEHERVCFTRFHISTHFKVVEVGR